MLFDHLSGIKAATGHSWSPQQLSGPLLIPTSLWDWFPYSSHPPDWQKHAWRHKERQAVQTDQPAAALEVQWGKKKKQPKKTKAIELNTIWVDLHVPGGTSGKPTPRGILLIIWWSTPMHKAAGGGISLIVSVIHNPSISDSSPEIFSYSQP